ncbi:MULTISPECIES: hypothetical protein [Nocardioides]|uniref:Uncharacterized protein n=1 Tax=Nocardioides vastitatis TaxID=2568655 RepID=A0ABW0ZMY9_9ACTN|nr:hypothetical protein [Nocardioides sp.]
MKSFARKAAVAAFAVVATFGFVAMPTAAEADTGWGWSAPRN